MWPWARCEVADCPPRWLKALRVRNRRKNPGFKVQVRQLGAQHSHVLERLSVRDRWLNAALACTFGRANLSAFSFGNLQAHIPALVAPASGAKIISSTNPSRHGEYTFIKTRVEPPGPCK